MISNLGAKTKICFIMRNGSPGGGLVELGRKRRTQFPDRRRIVPPAPGGWVSFAARDAAVRGATNPGSSLWAPIRPFAGNKKEVEQCQ